MRIGMRQLLGQVAMVFILSTCVNGGEVAERKTVTLARHETVAEFRGTNYHRCMGLTSLCPDKCGQSGTLATFRIVNYVTYDKLGEYGDPKCDKFAFLVEDNMKHPKVPAAIRAAVNSLKQGDIVLLSWNHDYVTINGSSGPERPLTLVEKMADVGTKEWLHQIDRRAFVGDAAGHGPNIGSDEWMQAVSVKLGVYDNLGHGPTPDSAEWRNAIQWKAFGVEPSTNIRVVYVSVTGEQQHATYDLLRQNVTLTTTNGAVTLPQAVSASGAKYTADESEVFWNKGSAAKYWKSGKLLFEGVERTNRAEPDGSANGSQPIRSETNGTSSSAGSRR